VTGRRKPPAQSRVKPHQLEQVDADGMPIPADQLGRAYCGRCGVAGTPGDERHPLDAPPMPRAVLPPTPAEAQLIDARRLGEFYRTGA
jgi:hypothetical protein